MSRVVLVCFAFFGVFAAGAITGGIIDARLYRSLLQKRASEQFTQQQFKRVADQLGLSEDQKARIRPIVTMSSNAIQEKRRENSAILERMELDVRAQLTDEQQAKFDAIRARQHENERLMQRWLKEQRARRQEVLNALVRDPAFSPKSQDPADATPVKGSAR